MLVVTTFFLIGYIAYSFYFGLSLPFVCIGYIISSVLDTHSTMRVVGSSHLEYEINPIVRWCMKKFGVIGGLIFVKVLGACALLVFLYFRSDFLFYVLIVSYIGSIAITCAALLNYTDWFWTRPSKRGDND